MEQDYSEIRNAVSTMREQMQNGEDISSALIRLENRLSRMTASENTDPNKPTPAEAFFARKKKEEGNWENPLREYKLRR